MLDFNLHIKPIVRDSFILTGKINDFKLLEELKKDIDKGVKKNNNNYKTNVHGKMTAFKYFNKNNNFIKLIDILKPYFNKVTKKNIELQDSWGNILKGEDFVYAHDHFPSVVSGVVYLTKGEGTYFHYYDYTIMAEIGSFVLFDSIIPHEVKKNYFKEKRYTLAFNFNMISDFKDLHQ
jgi:metal-dependent amidase/aminoacylase/carboxypeptidase family protein